MKLITSFFQDHKSVNFLMSHENEIMSIAPGGCSTCFGSSSTTSTCGAVSIKSLENKENGVLEKEI